MTPAEANIREHGALGASQLEVRALREQLATATDYQDAIASFVKAIETEVAAIRERDAALARIADVRAVTLVADHGAMCAIWIAPPAIGGVGGACDCILADLRAVLDPTEGATP